MLSLRATVLPRSLPASAPAISVLTYQAPCRFSWAFGRRPGRRGWVTSGRPVRIPVGEVFQAQPPTAHLLKFPRAATSNEGRHLLRASLRYCTQHSTTADV